MCAVVGASEEAWGVILFLELPLSAGVCTIQVASSDLFQLQWHVSGGDPDLWPEEGLNMSASRLQSFIIAPHKEVKVYPKRCEGYDVITEGIQVTRGWNTFISEICFFYVADRLFTGGKPVRNTLPSWQLLGGNVCFLLCPFYSVIVLWLHYTVGLCYGQSRTP